MYILVTTNIINKYRITFGKKKHINKKSSSCIQNEETTKNDTHYKINIVKCPI